MPQLNMSFRLRGGDDVIGLSGCVEKVTLSEVTSGLSRVLLEGVDGSEGLPGLSYQDSRGTIDDVLS